ncbi:helix-turn-helix domain-containing protein, partial [Paenibacillus alkaliterrae]
MWYTYPWKRRLTYLLRAYKYRIYPNEVQRV